MLEFLFCQSMHTPTCLKALYRQLIIRGGMFGLGAAVFSYYNGLPPLGALLASVSTIAPPESTSPKTATSSQSTRQKKTPSSSLGTRRDSMSWKQKQRPSRGRMKGARQRT